jgi:hypothetical protein
MRVSKDALGGRFGRGSKVPLKIFHIPFEIAQAWKRVSQSGKSTRFSGRIKLGEVATILEA